MSCGIFNIPTIVFWGQAEISYYGGFLVPMYDAITSGRVHVIRGPKGHIYASMDYTYDSKVPPRLWMFKNSTKSLERRMERMIITLDEDTEFGNIIIRMKRKINSNT